MRISDWSSDVCSSDLQPPQPAAIGRRRRSSARALGCFPPAPRLHSAPLRQFWSSLASTGGRRSASVRAPARFRLARFHFTAAWEQPRVREPSGTADRRLRQAAPRSEEHTSELQSLMRSSYAVFCLKKKKKNK